MNINPEKITDLIRKTQTETEQVILAPLMWKSAIKVLRKCSWKYQKINAMRL